MKILRSEGHDIYSMHMNKISLSPFDSKRWIDEDGIHTKAYGYKEEDLEQMEAELAELEEYTDDELGEMVAELLNLLGGSCVLGWTTSSSSRTKPRLGSLSK